MSAKVAGTLERLATQETPRSVELRAYHHHEGGATHAQIVAKRVAPLTTAITTIGTSGKLDHLQTENERKVTEALVYPQQ